MWIVSNIIEGGEWGRCHILTGKGMGARSGRQTSKTESDLVSRLPDDRKRDEVVVLQERPSSPFVLLRRCETGDRTCRESWYWKIVGWARRWWLSVDSSIVSPPGLPSESWIDTLSVLVSKPASLWKDEGEVTVKLNFYSKRISFYLCFTLCFVFRTSNYICDTNLVIIKNFFILAYPV